MCGKRLYAWKTIPILRRSALTSTLPRGDRLAVDDDRARLDALEQVEAAQQRRLARAGGADQADDLVLVDGQVDVVAAPRCSPKRFGDVVDLDEVPRVGSSALRPLAPLALGDQVVGEARQRDREEDEEHRGDHVAA